jgi:hypothetical protein
MSPNVVDGSKTSGLSRHFFARGFRPPASVIVFAVSRQAGANAVAVARSVRQLLPQLQKELPARFASSRPSTAPNRSSIRSTTCSSRS